MNYSKYAAEALGTFALTFVVWLASAYPLPLATPILAALTIGLFVYNVGHISGAHFNPAITIGMLSVRKIRTNDAVFYVACQLVGATVAAILGRMMRGHIAALPQESTLTAGFTEALGAFVLAFGVMSVTMQKVHAAASGLVVGLSLFIGICMAMSFSNAILNPAVALGLGAFGPLEILGPVVGAVAGVWARNALEKTKQA